MLDRERLSSCKKLMDDLAMLGFEPAPLRRREPLVRNDKIADGIQRVPHLFQFLFEATAERGDVCRSAIRRPHRIERIREQRPPFILMITSAIGADQSERLLPLQAVSRYRFAHGLLGRIVERTERMRQRDAHISLVDEADHRFAQPLGQHQAGRHPRRLSAQNTGDPLGTELLLQAKGAHHPRFVHRRERARRTIRFEKCDLLLQAGHRFRYHRHFRKPRASPPFEAFETVDDLVKSVRRLCDTQRQITEAYRPLRHCLAS